MKESLGLGLGLRLRLGFRLGLRIGRWRRGRRRGGGRVVVAAAREHVTGTQEHGKKEKIFVTDMT